MPPKPTCPDCRCDLCWPVPPGTPNCLRYWVGGPYTCPKCNTEFDVSFVMKCELRLKHGSSFVMTTKEEE